MGRFNSYEILIYDSGIIHIKLKVRNGIRINVLLITRTDVKIIRECRRVTGLTFRPYKVFRKSSNCMLV